LTYKDPQKRREADKIYYLKNREKIIKRRKELYPKYKEQRNKRRREYYPNIKEKQNKRDIEYYNNNKEKKKLYRIKHSLKYKYNLTVNDFNELLQLQFNKCGICEKDLMDEKKCIDHDHITGKIRGILCDYCNKGLGMLWDTHSSLLKAVKYLEKEFLAES
jgi:ATP-dependent Lon protease